MIASDPLPDGNDPSADVLAFLPAGAAQHLLERLFQELPCDGREEQARKLLACVVERLQSNPLGGFSGLDLSSDVRWLLELCCGRMPMLMPWEFGRLCRFLGASALVD